MKTLNDRVSLEIDFKKGVEIQRDVISFPYLSPKLFFSIVLTPFLTDGQKCFFNISPSQMVVAKGLLPSTSPLRGSKVPSPRLSSVFHRAATFFSCVLVTLDKSPIMAKQD